MSEQVYQPSEVYKPPEAELLRESETDTRFYVVSKTKLIVLYFVTLGLYGIYWFYTNWRNYKTVTGEKLWPVPRSIFYIFFTHTLFNKVEASLKDQELEYDWSPSGLAAGYVIVSIATNVLDQMAQRSIGSPITDMIGLLMLPLALIFLVKAQEAINLSQGDPTGSSNSRFTVANIIWIVIGLLFWMLVLVGVLDMFGVISLDV